MRRTIILTTMFVLFCTAMAAGASAARAHDRGAVENAVLQLINRERTSRGLHAVRIQADLDAAAIAHSRQMLSLDYFSHYSAGGATYADRLRAAGYGRARFRSWAVGEVIGWGSGAAGSAQAMVRTWMRSSGHRAVILDRRWRDAGIGCAQGSYRGIGGTLMYTVDFGRRTR